MSLLQYGVVRFPETGLNDAGHVAFAARFGELDDVTVQQASILRAAQLPPAGTSGATEFADSRSAYDDLPQDLKSLRQQKDYVACHSLYHSRKTASPEALPGLKPEDHFMSRHCLVQKHEASGRMNLYMASHVHHIGGLETEESRVLVERLYGLACKGKYVVSIPWDREGDLVVWDNTCVMYRSTGGGLGLRESLLEVCY
ncbi:Alpha-ketoglutarate-dependent 2,4-dichlorophenoxyacetate dioxygenase [Fulvia fulva]|uniref:Alpha-ketoglutarate-dependent 2,4-dichlorophenoxyacetate dioxygenase n=1 Tax=Passalora fulva TaxID=5499 RepID=A0A9Q8LBY5_PASFU|nr:Alpha-ketoglutarate-dependent 2,4-dichlorophenoxyacetate dioxygenase [Fulvia fulva]KAK4633570.1 Alpha-ketoglutarate-dependent 2,4-dichlorophenoxyacetate dioxygenase [Fulvia fulva]UJO14569.1 Alpha-ketoglutarate-dependent 2,4-dichlorophenoxyacetate dioxygenase [Fulvia fulva]WPV10608.1 Alpha-ketoglutarate-dependent 2,4-dichlorophenoxyacetate dioxygenase [Fulvia fulva]